MASTTNNLLGLLWQKELPWCCQFGVEALVEDVVATEAVEEAAAEVAEVNKHFLLALETGNVQNRTAETQTLPGETTATNAKPLNQLEPEAVVMTEVETAEEVEDLEAGAAEASVEATEIVVVVEALEVAAEAVPCVEAVAVETVIVPTKQEEQQQTKQDMPPLTSVSPPSVFSLAPGIYYLSRSFFRSFPTISSPNGLVLL